MANRGSESPGFSRGGAVKFNVNDYVRVKLTDRGRTIHRTDHENFAAHYPGVDLPYKPPTEDANGWSTWQMWHLMQLFGPHIVMGFNPPFEPTIEIEGSPWPSQSEPAR